MAFQKTHGQSNRTGNSKAWNAWHSMRSRCNTESDKDYENYGGRGIKVCGRWDDFENFLADMGEPEKGLTLDRKDVDGDYYPDNCKWATRREQANNRRSNKTLTYRGVTKTYAEWERHFNLSRGTVCKRITNGWTKLEALLTPMGCCRKTQGY